MLTQKILVRICITRVNMPQIPACHKFPQKQKRKHDEAEKCFKNGFTQQFFLIRAEDDFPFFVKNSSSYRVATKCGKNVPSQEEKVSVLIDGLKFQSLSDL